MKGRNEAELKVWNAFLSIPISRDFRIKMKDIWNSPTSILASEKCVQVLSAIQFTEIMKNHF